MTARATSDELFLEAARKTQTGAIRVEDEGRRTTRRRWHLANVQVATGDTRPRCACSTDAGIQHAVLPGHFGLQ